MYFFSEIYRGHEVVQIFNVHIIFGDYSKYALFCANWICINGDRDPIVAPFEYITEPDGISQADDLCRPCSVIQSLCVTRYFVTRSSIFINGIAPPS